MDGEGLVGRRGRDRARCRDRPRRPRHRGVDGAAGCLEDGARATRRLRRRDAHLLARLGRALGALRPRARGSPQAPVAPQARPAGARSRSASPCSPSTAARCSRALPLASRRSLYLLVRMAWIGFRGPRPGSRRRRLPHWPVWSLAVATLFLLGFRIGLNVEEERRVIDVGYAGVIGADRILDGQAPYGAHARDGAPHPVRRGGLRRRGARADPVERPLRVGQPAR